jgi:hypothetical protein
MLDHITPVLLTYNEERNIGRTLSWLKWVKDVVVGIQTALRYACETVALYGRRDANRHALDPPSRRGLSG